VELLRHDIPTVAIIPLSSCPGLRVPDARAVGARQHAHANLEIPQLALQTGSP
jgi:hypothetical protein